MINHTPIRVRIPPVNCNMVGNTPRKIQARIRVHTPFELIIKEVLVASIIFNAWYAKTITIRVSKNEPMDRSLKTAAVSSGIGPSERKKMSIATASKKERISDI